MPHLAAMLSHRRVMRRTDGNGHLGQAKRFAGKDILMGETQIVPAVQSFAQLREAARSLGARRVAILCAEDEVALTAASDALLAGIARPQLVGEEEAILCPRAPPKRPRRRPAAWPPAVRATFF
jgi:hypothetical protein